MTPTEEQLISVYGDEEEALRDIQDELEEIGLGLVSRGLRHRYVVGPRRARARAAQAQAEREALGAEIEDRNRPDPTSPVGMAESRLECLRDEHERARARLTDAAAKAGLVLLGADDALADGESASPISVSVRDAIDGATPSEPAVAGEVGMPFEGEPDPTDIKARLHAVVPAVVALVAPFLIGPLVGLAIGVVTGIVDLEAISDPGEHLSKLLFLSLLGFAAVMVLGTLAEGTVRAVSEHGLEEAKDIPASSAPGWTANARLLALGVTLAAAVIGEVLVEAQGIRDLYMQHLAYLARTSDAVGPKQMPLVLAILVGCIITLPYVASKLALADHHWKTQLRSNYIAYRRESHRARWLEHDGARAVLAAAGHAQRCEQRVAGASEELNQLRSAADTTAQDLESLHASEQRRLDAERLRDAAEEQFDAALRQVVEALQPLPKVPWWARLLGLWWVPARSHSRGRDSSRMRPAA